MEQDLDVRNQARKNSICSESFQSLLKDVGYAAIIPPENLNYLDSSSSEVKMFLASLSKNISIHNSLPKVGIFSQQLKKYNDIQRLGCLKTNEEINEMKMMKMPPFIDVEEEKALAAEVAETRRRVQKMQSKKSKLEARQTLLHQRLASRLKQNLCSRDTIRGGGMQAAESAMSQLRLTSKVVAELMGKIQISLEKMSQNPTKWTASSNHLRPLLAAACMDEYSKQEDGFHVLLWKLYQDQIEALGSKQKAMETSHPKAPEWLHDLDPASFGSSEEDYHKLCLELYRLENTAPFINRCLLKAQEEVARAKAVAARLMATQALEQSAVDQVELGEQIIAIQTESTRYRDAVLPELYAEVARLQATSVLIGDYEQKLLRLQHRVHRQNSCISLFSEVRARYLFLVGALNAELHFLLKVAQQLEELKHDLECSANQLQLRLEEQLRIVNPEIEKEYCPSLHEKQNRAIDGRDYALGALLQILGATNEDVHTYNDLEAMCGKVCSNASDSSQRICDAIKTSKIRVQELNDCASAMEKELFPCLRHESEASGMANLGINFTKRQLQQVSSWHLRNPMLDKQCKAVEEAKSVFEEKWQRVIKGYEEKAQSLEYSDHFERGIFPLFYSSDPTDQVQLDEWLMNK